MPDPGETRLLLQEQADVAGQSMRVILACLQQLDPDRRGRTAAEIIKWCQAPGPCPPDYQADLTNALEDLLGKLDARLLGYKLRAYRRRIFRGLYLEKVGAEHKTTCWAVFPATEFRQQGDMGGDG